MDRTVLVVLLCLQAFLLITAFTSTDAAALVTHEDQQLSSDVKRTTSCPRPGMCGVKRPRCRRPGACVPW
ncbi:uncharacterized protein AKAME5_002845000 [Lates japonicus]|uniref:Uncharacterized protein n=1 Tax=Lates japonicus TaxID=270547 RepID=A0AAD3MJL4_LATJO|nr:uncharacterized protein AKAME5_002845000 [Lates japonicus]